MKKFFIIFACVILLLTGCGDSSSEKRYKDDNGNTITETDSTKTIYLKSLPSELQFNNTSIQYIALDMYQDNSYSGHGYNIYATLTIDVSNLSDDELYWLDKDTEYISDKTLQVKCYITDEHNDLDFESMSPISVVVDGKKRTYTFMLINEFKNDFTNASLSGYVNLMQDETYKQKSDSGLPLEINRVFNYQYEIDCTDNYKLLTIDDMDTNIYNSINNALQSKL